MPLFPCSLDRNSTSTIQHKYASWPKEADEFGCADGKGQGSRRAVMFTTGGGTLAGPSLELEGFLSLKLKRPASSPGLIRPSALP